jgi:hypothetical protein
MTASTRWPVLAALALAALLSLALMRLFELRYARGDVYPPHSTLRADPLGAKAIFDALSGMPGFEARRNYRPLVRLKPSQPVTLVYAGVPYEARWSEDELPEFESLVNKGARAVFAFSREFKTTDTQRLASGTPGPRPRQRQRGPSAQTPPPGTPIPGVTPKAVPEPDDWEEGIPFRDAAARWGFAFDIAQDEEIEALSANAERADDAGDLEPTVPWHSALYFKGLGRDWRVLYRCNGVPVIAERAYGEGSIVIASDSFFITNEGLRNARAPKLLARLIGPPRTVIFDEEHLGVTESMNVAGLARKYDLEGALLAVLFVVALFIWKNAVPFLPPHADRQTTDVAGAAASEGFVNLLRRSVPSGQILAACVNEWRRARGRRVRPEELAHVETVLRAHDGRGVSGKDAAAAYRTIAEGLRRR